ncbi:MAG: lipoprotein signal peptidase [Bacteroidaceae bacterium]|nr:lipoprotein signal peptidase [Bacteroidaceae bacterium]
MAIVVILLVILIDQVVKYTVKTGMLLHEQVSVTSWFKIFFTENQGMAFGMDFVGTMLLTLFRVVAIVFFVIYLARLVKRDASFLTVVCLSLIIAGALGNVIDNCFYGLIFTESPEAFTFGTPAQLVGIGQGYGSFLSGKVVDMFYFPLWQWPEWMPLIGGHTFFNAVFNVADAAITCGAIVLLVSYYLKMWRTPKSKQSTPDTPESAA